MATGQSNQPTPEYKRNTGSPDQLPKGGAAQLNAASQQLPDDFSEPELNLMSEDQDPKPEGSVTAFDDVLFGPTDHPNEPITTGASFGPGANTIRQGRETDKEFLARTAYQLASSPSASPRVKAFAARIARGE